MNAVAAFDRRGESTVRADRTGEEASHVFWCARAEESGLEASIED